MFKLLCLFGCFIPSLYRLYSDSKLKHSSNQRSGQLKTEATAPFIHFAPKLTIITKIDVPIRSRNGRPALEQLSADTRSASNGAASHGLLNQKLLNARGRGQRSTSAVTNQTLPGASEPLPLNGTKMNDPRVSRRSLSSL
jgi:hypothetical protein